MENLKMKAVYMGEIIPSIFEHFRTVWSLNCDYDRFERKWNLWFLAPSKSFTIDETTLFLDEIANFNPTVKFEPKEGLTTVTLTFNA